MMGIEWASWVQAVIMIAAICLAPSTVSAAYGYLFSRMDVDCIPYFSDREGRSRFWELRLSKRFGQVLDSNLSIYVPRPGNTIQEATIITPNDSALSAKIEEDEHGCIDLIIKRVMSGRRLTLRLSLALEDVPCVHARSGTIRKRLVVREGEPSQIKVVGSVFHYRMLLLLTQFALCIGVIVLRLGYLAIWH